MVDLTKPMYTQEKSHTLGHLTFYIPSTLFRDVQGQVFSYWMAMTRTLLSQKKTMVV